MFQLVKEKTAKYKALDPFRIINPTEKRVDKIKKSNDPGPDTYKVAEQTDKNRLRASISNKFVQQAKINYMQKHLRNKKFVPGVGHYQKDKNIEVLSAPVTSLRVRRK